MMNNMKHFLRFFLGFGVLAIFGCLVYFFPQIVGITLLAIVVIIPVGLSSHLLGEELIDLFKKN